MSGGLPLWTKSGRHHSRLPLLIQKWWPVLTAATLVQSGGREYRPPLCSAGEWRGRERTEVSGAPNWELPRGDNQGIISQDGEILPGALFLALWYQRAAPLKIKGGRVTASLVLWSGRRRWWSGCEKCDSVNDLTSCGAACGDAGTHNVCAHSLSQNEGFVITTMSFGHATSQ